MKVRPPILAGGNKKNEVNGRLSSTKPCTSRA